MLVGLLVLLQSIDLSDSFALLARTPLWILPAIIMNGLFALAGFTIARSQDHNGPKVALGRTAWRFLPALVVVVLSTALIAGAALTVQRRAIYFSDALVWTYLLNILGYPQNFLPGVFLNNNIPSSINAITWAIPVSYFGIAIVMLAGRRWRFGSLLLASAAIFGVILGVLLQFDLLPSRVSSSLVWLAGGRALNGAIAFLAGALAYRERAKLVVDSRIATLIALGTVAFSLFGEKRLLESAIVGPVVAIGAAYVALFLGSLRLPLRHAVLRSEPLLWRVFLLAYPVQQLWIAVGPDRQGVWLNMALSVPVIVLSAGAMWYGLELPLLRRLAPATVANHPAYEVQDRPMRQGRVLDPIATMRAALPHIVAAVVIVLLTLAAIAIAVFALQRDRGGI